MFSIFLLKQVKYFLADKNTCVILCEFLNKVCITFNYYYYYYYYYYLLYQLHSTRQKYDVWTGPDAHGFCVHRVPFVWKGVGSSENVNFADWKRLIGSGGNRIIAWATIFISFFTDGFKIIPFDYHGLCTNYYKMDSSSPLGVSL